MKPEVWDTYKCHVGEGPVATGMDHQRIYWVDILNNLVISKDLASGERNEIHCKENVSFVLPRTNGGLVLGTADGPIAMEPTGELHLFPTRADAEGSTDPILMRWNDAKVGPCGEIWMGTSAYGVESELIGLHKLSANGRAIERVLRGMGLSNGMDWSPDARTFYLIDTLRLTLFAFDYDGGQISNQRVALSWDPSVKEYPDGMTVDSDGCLWIAFWNGNCIKKYSPTYELLETINFPVRFVSSCAFAGTDLSTLVITTAVGDNGWHDDHPSAGMTFVMETDVKGKAPYVFAA